jgi:Ser/Thr protein kinase RdoA (MazF antagonist)
MTPPVRLTPLTDGINNIVYRVESASQTPYILRIYRTQTDIARMRHEVALHIALAQTLLPFAVPSPIPTRDGLLIKELDETPFIGRAVAVLWTHIPGAHPDPADVDQARAGGAALALLDRALETIDPQSLAGTRDGPAGESHTAHSASRGRQNAAATTSAARRRDDEPAAHVR